MGDVDSDGDEEYSPDDRNYNPWLAFNNHSDDEASDDEESDFGCAVGDFNDGYKKVKKMRITIQMNLLTT